MGVTFAAAAYSGPWAQLVHVGPEFQVNTYTTNTQGDPSIAVDASGSFVVVWESFGQDGSGFGVFGRRYDDAGNPEGPEFQVNTFTTGNQYAPAVGADPSGGFAVVWESSGQDGSGFGVSGRRYDDAGNPKGAEFQVNLFTTGDQFAPSLAFDALGNFVVVWGSDGQDGSGYGVFGRRFDTAGSPRGAEFQVNTYATNSQFPTGSAVDADPSGNFVVVWQSFGQDGHGAGVFGQRFDNDGNPQGAEFQANTFTTGGQSDPLVAVDPSGKFMVTWDSFMQDGSSWGVFAQHFESSGAPAGPEFQVNTETYSGQVLGSIAADTAGGFVVVWYSALQDGSELGIFGKRSGAEFQVNTFTTGEQNLPSIGVDASGNFVVAWYSFAQDGSDLGIFGQRLACSPEAGVVTDLGVETAGGGAQLIFTWSPTAGAEDYVVFEDDLPYGAFSPMTGTVAADSTGLTVPTPPGDLIYFLVAGRNGTCGLGPMR